jgi:hypothetical protein
MEMESLVKVQCTIFDTLLIIAIIFILDIMECQLGGSSPCSDDATCTDTHGSFTCICNSGFTGDGFSCESKSWLSIWRALSMSLVFQLRFLIHNICSGHDLI